MEPAAIEKRALVNAGIYCLQWGSGLKVPRLMRVACSTALTALLFSAFSTQIVVAAATSPTDHSEFINLERLSRRVVLAYWVGLDRRCNLTAIRTTKGLVMIDTEMSPRIMDPIKRRLEGVFGTTNWVYVINTHAHDSHPGGNALFRGAEIVGHENLADDMRWIVRRQTEAGWKGGVLDWATQYIEQLRARLPQAARRSAAEARMVKGEMTFWELHSQDLRQGYDVVKPTLTYRDRRTFELGDVRLELVFFGKGHSASDTLIYVPQEGLLLTGGVVYQRAHFPEIGEETRMADLHRFLRVLDRFLADDVKIEHLIPSHSLPLLKADMVPVRDYYQRMLDGMRAAHRAGLTLDQAKARLSTKMFPGLRDTPPGTWSHGMHERNLNNLWRLVQEKDA